MEISVSAVKVEHNREELVLEHLPLSAAGARRGWAEGGSVWKSPVCFKQTGQIRADWKSSAGNLLDV